MRFFHVTPRRNVGSICTKGLYAHYYNKHAMLIGAGVPRRNLNEHLNDYRAYPACKRGQCSVVVMDVPDDEVNRYIAPSVLQRWYKRYEYYRALRRPIPPKYIKGFANVTAPTDQVQQARHLRSCSSAERPMKRYIREGRLVRGMSKFDGIGPQSDG